jgi:hypothetical protein
MLSSIAMLALEWRWNEEKIVEKFKFIYGFSIMLFFFSSLSLHSNTLTGKVGEKL